MGTTEGEGGVTQQPTTDEIQRVREHECGMAGHDFEVVQITQSTAPQGVVCSNCGRSWAVASGEGPPWTEEQIAKAVRAVDEDPKASPWAIFSELPGARPADP